MAVGLVVVATSEVVGAAGMLALIHTSWPDVLVLGLVMTPEVAGYVVKAYFLVLLPIVVFPRVLPITRLRVIKATVVGALVWAAANAIVTRVLFAFDVMWM